jgi:predicted glycosyltransferase involved in capsule biosynthesis
MQKIHNAVFYPLIIILPVATILLAFGNKQIGIPLILISVVLFIVEQMLLNEVVKEAKNTENSYTPPSRMEFLESTLGDELIGKQEGYDEAVLGFDYHSMRLIYSVEKVIEILMAQNDWEHDEAEEFAYFNIVGVRGASEPIWLECSINVEV